MREAGKMFKALHYSLYLATILHDVSLDALISREAQHSQRYARDAKDVGRVAFELVPTDIQHLQALAEDACQVLDVERELLVSADQLRDPALLVKDQTFSLVPPDLAPQEVLLVVRRELKLDAERRKKRNCCRRR